MFYLTYETKPFIGLEVPPDLVLLYDFRCPPHVLQCAH